MGSQLSGYSGERASFRLLIVGESGSGKTRLTSRMANALALIAGPGRVTALDFAPDYLGVGRPLKVDERLVKVVRPSGVKAPRLMSKGDCSMAWRLARENADILRLAIEQYLLEPTPVLVINDVSLYLHSGDPEILYDAIDSSTIFVANSYMGSALRDECGIWRVERLRVEELSRRMDLVWRL